MFDTILAVLTGGATGIIGSVLGKVFSFADAWIAEKKSAAEHQRTMQMHRLQAELRSEELENERAIVEEQASADLRAASYRHDQDTGASYAWVVAILRLVRPVLTTMLIIMVWYFYGTNTDLGTRAEIMSSVIYMASTAVLWWFGDRAMRSKR